MQQPLGSSAAPRIALITLALVFALAPLVPASAQAPSATVQAQPGTAMAPADQPPAASGAGAAAPPSGAPQGSAPDPSGSPGAPPAVGRPKLALVLSGGGARGAAHIGVLKVLEELHVPVDLVTGTSMGSIIGGLYATGWTPQEMEKLLVEMDWTKVFVDRLDRDERSFRRKQDDVTYLIPLKMRFKNWKPYIPPGVLGGQRLEILLRSLEIESTGETDFDRFPIPFRAVAADIVTGETVVLGRGSLADAMRASMSIPGAFPPIELEGHRLVDGGAVANLPIRVAQGLGATSVIAVDITSPLSKKDEITSFLSVMNQQSGFLTVGNRIEDLKHVRPGDVVIRPELGDISFIDFKRATEAVGIGEAAARALASELRKFAVSDEEWAVYMARHHRRPAEELIVDNIELVNSSWVDDRVIEPYIEQKTGAPLDVEVLGKDIACLSGLDYFGIIREDFRRDAQGRTLVLDTPAKPYGKNSLQFGLALRDDFKGESSYTLSVRHLLLAVNRRGGEWENRAQIGTPTYFGSTFYQPLDYGMRWFVQPSIEWQQTTQSIWADGEAIAEFQFHSAVGRLEFGRVLGNWGEVRVGAFYANFSGRMRIGPPVVPPFDQGDGGLRFVFRVDTRNSTVFTRTGTLVEAVYRDSSSALGADQPFRQWQLLAGEAWTFGKNTIYPEVQIGDNLVPGAPFRFTFALGGLIRLSGLAQNELIGERYGLARIAYYRELTKLDLGVASIRLYVGATAEAGNVYMIGDPVSLDTLRHGGSVFVGADTPIGPVVFAWGAADGGRRRLYLVIGESF